MNGDSTVWNNFCKSVLKAQRNNERELDFEKSTMIDLLSGLGWSSLKDNLVEQKSMVVAHTSVFADFVLLDTISQKEQIVIELKRPNHNQSEEDIRQLWSYMKLSFAPYGLYVGEKIEIYYNRLDRNEPVLINTINFTANNEEGIFLLKLLKVDTFDVNRWKNYCEDSIKLKKSIQFWTSPEGKEELSKFILSRAGLSPDFTNRLRTLLTISVERNQVGSTDVTTKDTSEEKAQETSAENKETNKQNTHKKNSQEYRIGKSSYKSAKSFALAIVKKYMELHPNFSFDQIKAAFPKSFAWGHILVTEEEWKAKKPSVQENYFSDDILTDANGQHFLLSNQWTRDAVADMRKVLDEGSLLESQESYKVSSEEDNLVADPHVQVKPVFKMPRKGSQVYSLNGGRDFFPAGAMGYNIVRRYLDGHPESSSEEIAKLMPAKVFGYRTIIDANTYDMKFAPGKKNHIRYVPYAFTDGLGKRFYVSNQWDKASIAELEPIIAKLGWSIEKKIKG